jgi:glycosyltransferase involved in cell wall biosynthesis
MTAVPPGSVVLIDGLIASSVPDVITAQANRLRLVLLVHMPLGAVPTVEGSRSREAERSALTSAAAIVATSSWTQDWLLSEYGIRAGLIHVAVPGVDPAAPSTGTPDGAELLCVAAVTPNKGHDVLLAALAQLADVRWRCTIVGSLDRDRNFVGVLEQSAQKSGIADRVQFVGARTATDLDAAYAQADMLVLASRGETYGMVITEALARGLPVIATDVGGVPEALGTAGNGVRPGLLIPVDDPIALASALRRWLDDAAWRDHLRRVAAERRLSLSGWSTTSHRISRVLREVAA